jgi:hypothetical protein
MPLERVPMRATDANASSLFKENLVEIHSQSKQVASVLRLTCCMKRILLISAVLFGAVSASQAGVRLNIGIGIPLPGLVIGRPAPVVVVPPPVCAPPPTVFVAPPVIVAPAPVYYGCRPGWYGYRGWGPRRDWRHRW